MIYQNILQPIPFYNAPEHRTTGRENCRGQLIDGAVYPNTHIPAFVIERDPSANTAIEVMMIRRDNLLSANQGPASITVLNFNGRDFIFSPAAAMITPVAPGEYYMRVDDGGTFYDSEIFRLSDCTSRMASFEWSDTCKRAGIPWQIAPSGFKLKFWVDTHTGPSVVLTDEEVEDDGKVETVTGSRTMIQTSIAEVLPDHMLQCIHSLKMYGSVTLADGRVYDSIRIGQITSTPVASGCKQMITIPIILQDLRKDCCDDGSGSDTECIAEDAEQAIIYMELNDEAWFLANSSPGDIGLDISGTYAMAYENGGFPFFPIVDKYYMCAASDDGLSEDVLFYITGDIDETIANLVNPEIMVDSDGNGIIGVQSFIPGRYAEIQYSTNEGASWIVDQTVTEEQLQDGISGVESRVPLSGVLWHRVRYFTLGCEYGYSPTFVFMCCSSGTLTSSLAELDALNGEWTGPVDIGGFDVMILGGLYLFKEGPRWIIASDGSDTPFTGEVMWAFGDHESPCQIPRSSWVYADGYEAILDPGPRFCGSID